MDVTFICPAIWPMLLVAILVAMETLLRFMPLLLYMLLLFCWVNCGDVCCCENMLWRGEEHGGSINARTRFNQTPEGRRGPSLPAACHVPLLPAVHVRRALKRSVALALLHHRRLCVGHAWRQQGALWRARTAEASVCLLAHTCRRRTETVQQQHRLNCILKHRAVVIVSARFNAKPLKRRGDHIPRAFKEGKERCVWNKEKGKEYAAHII